ncbi:hypothetical protein HHI36_004434 [Cryptolaemus montrouzieri]|uniref:Uncharacterized protein n=1 Tax=Cryptolaemus montrouzieri TaxID=559131 RepID=A0ABD2NRB9_9CUCU
MDDSGFPVEQSMPFHPTDTPRGTMYYNLEELTDSQQIKLNSLKIDTIRQDEKYLAAHPEIRAIVVLLMRMLLRHRPMIKVHEFIAKFFNRSESDIQDEVYEYLATREGHVSENLSAVNFALSKKPIVKKESIIDRPLDYICGEECSCAHALQWKLSPYEDADVTSFSETEHWLTPKSSKTSMTVEDHLTATDEDFTTTELAQMIDLIGADEEEETEVGGGMDDDEDSFFLDQASDENLPESEANEDKDEDSKSGADKSNDAQD